MHNLPILFLDIKEKVTDGRDAELLNQLPDKSKNNLLVRRSSDASVIVIKSSEVSITYKDDDFGVQDSISKVDTTAPNKTTCPAPATATKKPHQCDVCGKTFIKTSQLIVHKRTHTGKLRNSNCW